MSVDVTKPLARAEQTEFLMPQQRPLPKNDVDVAMGAQAYQQKRSPLSLHKKMEQT
jgi:hypothetical protein